MEILKSASKIVLIAFAFAIIAGLFLGKVSEESFMTVVMVVFTYYFVKRADKKDDPTP